MVGIGERENNCAFCPEFARERGTEVIGMLGEMKEVRRRVPYVWVATSSRTKFNTLLTSLQILEGDANNPIDWGLVMQMPEEVASAVGPESNYTEGAAIAEEKVREYWDKWVSMQPIHTCHKYNNCHEGHLVLANDVNCWKVRAGSEPEVEMRKLPANVRTEKALVKYIVMKYKEFAERTDVRAKGGLIGHRIEAAVAMLKPVHSKDWDKVRVVTGVSRAFLHFPIEPMLNEKFVGEYVKAAVKGSGHINKVLGAADGIMNEYLMDTLMENRYAVHLDVPGDDRYEADGMGGIRGLFLAHARGFPPRLIWKLWNNLESPGNAHVGESRLLMEPKG